MPEQNSQRAGTFADAPSQFYVATDGEITASIDNENRSFGGTCTAKGSKTFALKDLPSGARQYLVLEVTADGRYRLMLGMVSYFLQFDATQRCTGLVRVPDQKTNVNSVGIRIGQQDGRVSDEGIVGQLAQPVVVGPLSYTGEWRFKKIP
jgi:hypothetical protein